MTRPTLDDGLDAHARIRFADRPLLETPFGRCDDHGLDRPDSLLAEEIAGMPLGGRPLSEVTADSGPGSPRDDEDGLDAMDAEVRREAEDPIDFRETWSRR